MNGKYSLYPFLDICPKNKKCSWIGWLPTWPFWIDVRFGLNGYVVAVVALVCVNSGSDRSPKIELSEFKQIIQDIRKVKKECSVICYDWANAQSILSLALYCAKYQGWQEIHREIYMYAACLGALAGHFIIECTVFYLPYYSYSAWSAKHFR